MLLCPYSLCQVCVLVLACVWMCVFVSVCVCVFSSCFISWSFSVTVLLVVYLRVLLRHPYMIGCCAMYVSTFVCVCMRLCVLCLVCLILCVFCIFVFSGVCTIGCGASLWRLCVGAASRSVRFLCLPVVWWLICGFPLSVSLTSYSTPPFVLAISLLLSVLS